MRNQRFIVAHCKYKGIEGDFHFSTPLRVRRTPSVVRLRSPSWEKWRRSSGVEIFTQPSIHHSNYPTALILRIGRTRVLRVVNDPLHSLSISRLRSKWLRHPSTPLRVPRAPSGVEIFTEPSIHFLNY